MTTDIFWVNNEANWNIPNESSDDKFIKSD